MDFRSKFDTLYGVARIFLLSLIVLGAGHTQQKMRPLIYWPYSKKYNCIMRLELLWPHIRYLLPIGNHYLLYKPRILNLGVREQFLLNLE